MGIIDDEAVTSAAVSTVNNYIDNILLPVCKDALGKCGAGLAKAAEVTATVGNAVASPIVSAKEGFSSGIDKIRGLGGDSPSKELNIAQEQNTPGTQTTSVSMDGKVAEQCAGIDMSGFAVAEHSAGMNVEPMSCPVNVAQTQTQAFQR